MSENIEMVFAHHSADGQHQHCGGKFVYTSPMMDIRDNLAANLRYLRRREGFSQEDLSRRSKVSQSVISNLERASAYVRADIIEKLAPAFGEDVWVLNLPNELLEATDGIQLVKILKQLAGLTQEDREFILTFLGKLQAK